MLSEDLIQSYHENGYLVVQSLFDKKQVTSGIDAINQIIAGSAHEKTYELEPKDGATIRRIWSPTQKHDVFWSMATEPKLLDALEGLIGSNILFHYSKLNMKGPKVGSPVEWHQDFSYYPHTNCSLLSALIFLDDASVENGCLRVIPGSHKGGLLSHEIDGHFRGKVTNLDESKAVDLEVPSGSVVFLHCMTLHASNQNNSNRPRRTFLPAYRAADAYPIYFGPHAAHNESGIKLIRGEHSKVARVEAGTHLLPLAERAFGSLYDLQDGSYLTKEVQVMKTAGYAT